MASANTALINAFLGLQISGAVAFAVIALSACIFRGAKRHPIWFSFCISWIAFGISYTFLLFAGQQHRRPPGQIPCTLQSALVYAAPFLVMGTSLGLIIHLLLNVLSALSQSPKKQPYRNFLHMLVALPWMVWVAVLVGVLVFAFSHGHQVAMSPNGTFCVIQDSSIPKVTAVSVTIASAAIITLEFSIGFLLYRNRAIVNIFSQSLAMAIRILIFTILGFGALGVGLVFTVTRTRGVQFDLIIGILPPAAALTFGTQKDLLRGWVFWKEQAVMVPDQTLLTLTTVHSISSQATASIRRPSTISRRTQSVSIPPHPRPADAFSFLHF